MLALLWQLIAAPRLALVEREKELVTKQAVIDDYKGAYDRQRQVLIDAQANVVKLANDAKARDQIIIDANAKKAELAKQLTTVQRSFYEYKRNAPVDIQRCLDLPIGDMHEQLLKRFREAGANTDAMRGDLLPERKPTGTDASQ